MQDGQTLVAFADVAVYFSPEEWRFLTQWQRKLYWKVMESNLELVASLGSVPPEPELLCRILPGDEPQAPDPHRAGMWDTPGSPGSADQTGGGSAQEVKIPGEPGVRWRPPSSPPAWGALCPSWCEVKLTDVRSLSAGALLGGAWSPKQEELLICGQCGESFVDGDSLRQHQRGTHGAEAGGSDEGPEGERKPPFACPSCGKVFRYRLNLLTHKKHRGKRRHACAQCGAHFCLWGDLLRHRAGHAAEGAFPCGGCGLVFRHKRRLAAHEAEEHRGPGFGCLERGRDFAAESELLRHRGSEHGGDQPFACPTCGESFSWRESLQIHRRKHGPQRPFRCPVCQRSFSRQGNLLIHQRLHAAELPFSGPQAWPPLPQQGQPRTPQEAPPPGTAPALRPLLPPPGTPGLRGPQEVKEEAEP